MSLRFFRVAAIVFLLAIVAAVVCLKLIHRIVIVQQPTPSPTPSVTPAGIYVPKKTMEVAKLFSGITINSTVNTEKGLTAELERDDPSSYTLNLELKVRVPKPNTDLAELQKLNKNLPKALPWLEAALPKAKVSPFYDDFYRLKVNSLTRDLPRLEQLISRQHFFDCETALEFESASKRHALLIQAAMEVDTDGSDSDRVPVVDSNSSTFQP
ncbi:MAG TPA: hypothetical protein VG733_10960, partial [Chthoniobacteraceae bacterium]|nr:hypothetical protein [Chthoniobacteraceae bacterium]